MFAARWRALAPAVVLAAPLIVDRPAGRPVWVQGIVLVGLVLPLLGRYRRPEAMTAVVLGAAWLGLLTRAWPGNLPLAHLSSHVMLYTLVVRGRRRAAAVASLATAGFFAGWPLMARVDELAWCQVTYGLSIVTVWLLAAWRRARRAYVASIERRAELADSERRALSRAAAAEERTRIARELHDVLAHSVSVMVVNAEGAQLMRHTDPDVVDRTLRLVSSTGREALTELRRLLTVLDTDRPSTTPQPMPADLHRLVAGVDRAVLHVRGSETGVPAGAVVQTYRIVQEALTNVVKHAGSGAAAEVVVDLGRSGPGRVIRIEVRDDGTARISPRLPSSGRGVAGMRERVAMFGGTLDAAPRAEGGYRVVATLPLAPPVTAAPQVTGDSMSGWRACSSVMIRR